MPLCFHQIEIRSSRFPPMEGEVEESVTPEIYGKALALFLQEEFRAQEYSVPSVFCERQGWRVEIEGYSVRLTCRKYHEPDVFVCDLLGFEDAAEDYVRVKQTLIRILYGREDVRVLSEELGDL